MSHPIRTSDTTAGIEESLNSDGLIVKQLDVSAVVDAEGKPLVVYHGAKNDDNRFDAIRGLNAWIAVYRRSRSSGELW